MSCFSIFYFFSLRKESMPFIRPEFCCTDRPLVIAIHIPVNSPPSGGSVHTAIQVSWSPVIYHTISRLCSSSDLPISIEIMICFGSSWFNVNVFVRFLYISITLYPVTWNRSLKNRSKFKYNLFSVTIPFRTKESLKKDNRKFSRELRELQRRFQEVTNVIHHLEIDYETSKDDAPPIRYGKLKEIIKRSTTEEILEKSRPPSPKDIKAAAKLAGAEGMIIEKWLG